jgi:hypothetical protein
MRDRVVMNRLGSGYFDKTRRALQMEENSHYSAREKKLQQILQLPQFLEWAKSIPTVTDLEQVLFIRGGDQLRDEMQLAAEWAALFHPELLEDDS